MVLTCKEEAPLCIRTALLEVYVCITNFRGKGETWRRAGSSRSFADLDPRTSSDLEARPVPRDEMPDLGQCLLSRFQVKE